MRKVLLLLVACVFAAPAFAYPSLALRHHRHHHHHVVRAAAPQPNFFERLFGVRFAPQPAPPVRRHRVVIRKPHVEYNRPTVAQAAGIDTERPRDCYGIAWCGCWLRHHFGLNDVRLNLARAWAKVGEAAAPAIGVVVVWAHHVGLITGHDGQNWIVTSGNDRNAVRTHARSLHGAIAFRKI